MSNTALWMGAWWIVVLLKVAVVVLAVKRRIPAPVFIGFFAVSVARSLYLMKFSGAEYARAQAWTAPWMDGLAVAACIEAYVLACWRLPRVWRVAVVLGVVAVAGGLAVAWASGRAWPWPWGVPALERSVGFALAAGLGGLVLVLDYVSAVDQGALHHGAAMVLAELAAAIAYVVHVESGSGQWGTGVSMAGAAAAYVAWIWGVRRISLDRPRPGGPLRREDVDRAWGAGA